MPRTFIEATTVGDLVDRAASESSGDAIIFPDERVTFPELAALTDRFARSLRSSRRRTWPPSCITRLKIRETPPVQP